MKTDQRCVYDLKKALGDLGFEKVSTTTQGGEVMEETYFNLEGLKVTLEYKFMKDGPR